MELNLVIPKSTRHMTIFRYWFLNGYYIVITIFLIVNKHFIITFIIGGTMKDNSKPKKGLLWPWPRPRNSLGAGNLYISAIPRPADQLNWLVGF